MTETATTAADFAQAFPRAFDVFEQGRKRGLHHGAQVYVAVDGDVRADVGLGESEPGVPLTSDHLTLWLSAGKPLAAAAFARLWERGRLQLDAPVAAYLPEFGQQGKEGVTLRHVLNHTAGLRTVETGWPEMEWDATIARICAAPLDPGAVPGRTAGYHTGSSWFILGEVLQRVAGRSYADLLQEEVCAPVGMTETRAAIPAAEHAQLADRLAPLWERDRASLNLLDWHAARRCAAPSPGSNHRGPIRDLGRFYEMLRREGAAAAGRVLTPQTVAALTARHRVGEFDQTLGHVVDFGLGFIIDSNRYGVDTVPYGYGRHCSPRTFGHGGAQSSQGYCDPERGLVVAYLFNGRAGEGQHFRRAKAFNEALYADLGLATDA